MSRLNQFLTGTRIVDLSRYLPGPMASLLLADMGAEVLKIEPPSGDEMRSLGVRDSNDTPLFYEAVNAGKTVRRLNLKDGDDRAALIDEIGRADILIEGFRPGVMARLGLDHAMLRARYPRLITCAISGYGANSPQAQAAGHDANYLAASGVLHRNGTSPRFFDPPIADVSGALFAVIAILGALQARARDGQGCHIDLGLADVVMPLQLFELAGLRARGYSPAPETTYLNGGAAYYRIYPTADGRHVALGAVEPKFWASFCHAAGRQDWIVRQADALPQTALIAELSAMFARVELAHCLARFAIGDCCVTAVADLEEAVSSPHTIARQLVTERDNAWQALFPAWVDGIPPSSRPKVKEG